MCDIILLIKYRSNIDKKLYDDKHFKPYVNIKY